MRILLASLPDAGRLGSSWAIRLALGIGIYNEPTQVRPYDYHDNNFVVLTQLPTPAPTTKKKPALFRHKKGRNPAIEALVLSKAVVKQKPDTMMVTRW